MTCVRPNILSSVALEVDKPIYEDGFKLNFGCKTPAQAGSNVPLKRLGSAWASCNGSSETWNFQLAGDKPRCESDSGDFENKLQIVVTVFACTLMACLVFLMFAFGFKAYNYRRQYKKSAKSKPPSYRDVMMHPNAFPSKESLASSSTITVFASTEHVTPVKSSLRSPTLSSCACSSTSESSASRVLCKVHPTRSRRIKTVSFSDDIVLEIDTTTSSDCPPPYSEVKRELEKILDESSSENLL